MDPTMQTLRDSFRRLIPKEDLLAERFYATLFARYPETEALFEGVCFADQKRKLVRALALLVRNVERPEFLRPYLQGLGAIHLAYGVRPEHYPAFEECLIDALRFVAGPTWTAEEDAAWRAALARITQAMLEGAVRLR